ncbi:MAG: hypothetical protein A4E53_01547 [Pelotomaculum sp. PtaB.Bin104]|nr:MAG: hypothetical protein A4E53_01547 [Pelotomaculum sp. PtaB.Bin104]
MAVAVRTETTAKEKMRARAFELSERITRRTIAAGITREQLEKDVFEAFLDVKNSRRSRRN